MPFDSVLAIVGFMMIGLAFGARFVTVRLAREMTRRRKMALVVAGLSSLVVGLLIHLAGIPQHPASRADESVTAAQPLNQSAETGSEAPNRPAPKNVPGEERVADSGARTSSVPPPIAPAQPVTAAEPSPNVTATDHSVAAGRDMIGTNIQIAPED